MYWFHHDLQAVHLRICYPFLNHLDTKINRQFVNQNKIGPRCCALVRQGTLL